MTQPAYRCVECSQPAPAGQLLCAACAARTEARRPPSQSSQPPRQPSQPFPPAGAASYPSPLPPYPSPLPPAQEAAPAQPSSVYRGVSLPSDTPPPQAQVPPDMPAHYRLDLNGKPMPNSPPPDAAPPMPSGAPYLPQHPGGYANPGPNGRATTDPDALLAQLKLAEGGRYPQPSEHSFLERFATRLAGRFAVRAGVGAVLGLFVVISRLTGGAHSGSASGQTPDTGAQSQNVAARPAGSANGIASMRNSLQSAASPLVANAQTQELRAAISRVNAAWSDVENVLFSADAEGMRTDRPPDYRPFLQPLERDYQIIKQALPLMPLQDHQECVHMMRAIEAAHNELSRLIPRQSDFAPSSYPNGGASEGAAPNNTTYLPPPGGSSAPANGTIPAGQPVGQPAPQENGTPAAQGSAPGGTSGSGQPADNTPPPGASQGAPANLGQGVPPASDPPGFPPPAPGGN